MHAAINDHLSDLPFIRLSFSFTPLPDRCLLNVHSIHTNAKVASLNTVPLAVSCSMVHSIVKKRKNELIHKAQVKRKYHKQIQKDNFDQDTPDYVKEVDLGIAWWNSTCTDGLFDI